MHADLTEDNILIIGRLPPPPASTTLDSSAVAHCGVLGYSLSVQSCVRSGCWVSRLLCLSRGYHRQMMR